MGHTANIRFVATEFEPVTENAALKQTIRDAISEAGGAIRFRDYMELALYHPTLGYYTSSREKIGHGGDYLTSPEVSPLFAAMIGRQLRQMWELLGCPSRFEVVEAGPGTGALSRDIISWAVRAAPGLSAALNYALVAPHATPATFADTGVAEVRTDIPSGVRGCILSNELLDAMPVHRVVVENGALREIFVAADGDGFSETLRDAGADILAYFDALGLRPGDGCQAEVNSPGAPLDRRRGPRP
jgi:SAM-dependent MidA family methyltransferase